MFLDQLFLVCPCRVEEHINKRWLYGIGGTPLSSAKPWTGCLVVIVIIVVVVLNVVVVVFVVVNKRV